MTDEIRVNRETGTHAHGGDIARNADVEATITPDRTARTLPSETGDPGTARAQIEQTRARMSETIDEIEEVLVRKKEQLQDRMDVLAPVRENPLVAAGAVFGAGLLLGLITGGDDDDSGFRSERHHARDEELEERAGTWERRARRLLRVAREQEEELEALSSGRAVNRFSHGWDEEETEGDSFRDDLTDRVTEFVTHAVRGLFGTGSSNA